jgi:hypothetical protein
MGVQYNNCNLTLLVKGYLNPVSHKYGTCLALNMTEKRIGTFIIADAKPF